MEELNILIIDGVIASPYVLIELEEEKYTGRFTIETKRLYKNRLGNTEIESCFFTIELYGYCAKQLADKIIKGRGLRVVGRLKQENSRVFIVGEHFEFKVIRNKGESVQEELC